jgi:hypothetical protein
VEPEHVLPSFWHIPVGLGPPVVVGVCVAVFAVVAEAAAVGVSVTGLAVLVEAMVVVTGRELPLGK